MPAHENADLLVLAAHAPELVGLRTALGPTLAGKVSGLHVVCATVGVGMPIAGSGAMQSLRETKPRAVILLGSCGLYPKQAPFSPLQCVIPERVKLTDPAVLGGKAALPLPMRAVVETAPLLSHGLRSSSSNALAGALATTLSITTDDALARRLGKASGCLAENLEAFSVGLACASLSVPFSALLAVTNVVGSEGRKQWTRYQRRAAEQSGQLLLDWLHRGASGLPSR